MTKSLDGGLGLDFGGTLLRACLVDRQGRVVRKARMAAPRLAGVPAIVLSLKKRWKLGPLDGLILGGTGIWTPSCKSELRAALRQCARRIEIISDVELAHRAAFEGGPGILIIAGTGSIAFGKNPRGRTARAGGWGALLGDEGSAFWIGREALHDERLQKKFPQPLFLAHTPDTVRKTAALARQVIKLAAKQKAADGILNRAAVHLARLACEIKSELDWRGSIPVSWTGGLFQSRLFLAKFSRALKKADASFYLHASKTAPEVAAARQAARLSH